MTRAMVLAAGVLAPLPALAHPGHGGAEEILAAALLIAVAAVAVFVIPKVRKRRRDD
ncbi:MAG: hypothetical protein K2X74_21805 [Acetobacteraceae bacterium]|nr:hypothetical protein [Acetobacteraceae bacterium]